MDILDKIVNLLNEDAASIIDADFRDMDINSESDLEDLLTHYEDENPPVARWLEANFEEVANKHGIDLF